MFVDSGVCFGFWELFVPTSHGILKSYFLSNLVHTNFIYSFCFSLFYDNKVRNTLFIFSGGVCCTKIMFYICCLIKCVSVCEFFDIIPGFCTCI